MLEDLTGSCSLDHRSAGKVSCALHAFLSIGSVFVVNGAPRERCQRGVKVAAKSLRSSNSFGLSSIPALGLAGCSSNGHPALRQNSDATA